MQLEWLRGQLKFLKKMGIRGFTDLPDALRLEARPLGGEPNRMLYARGGPQELTIGVGYDSIRDLKDFATHGGGPMVPSSRMATASAADSLIGFGHSFGRPSMYLPFFP